MKVLKMCWVRVSFFLLVVLAGSPAKSQKYLSIIQDKDGSIFESIQSFPTGDSLFVFYRSVGKKTFHSICILPDSTQRSLQLDELDKKLIAGVSSNGDTLYFYYFTEQKNNLLLNRLALNKRDQQKRISGQPLAISGLLTGLQHKSNDFTIISFDERQSALGVTRTNGLTRTFEAHYPLPKGQVTRRQTIIQENIMILPSQADSDNKIYLTDRHLWVTLEARINENVSTCNIVRIDLATGETKTRTMHNGTGNKWNTFISDDKIFMVLKNKRLDIHVFEFDKEHPVLQTTIREADPISKLAAYERRGVTNEIFRINVWDVIDAWGRPFIVPYKTGPDSYILKVGMFEPMLNPRSDIPIIGIGVLGLITTVIRTAGYALNERVSSDRYFYLAGSVQNGFSHQQDTGGLPEQLIDEFELMYPVKASYIRSKGYTCYPKTTFGFYKYDRQYDLLKIKRFDHP